MTWRAYLVELLDDGAGHRSPDHFGGRVAAADPELSGVTWRMTDYGRVNWALLAADVNAAQQTYLDGLADVVPFPVNLDANIGGGFSTVSNKLEAARVPGGWISASTTWRELGRAIYGLFQFAGRYQALSGGGELVEAGDNLGAQYGTLSQARRDSIAAVVADLGLNPAVLDPLAPFRNVLKGLGDQWGTRAAALGGMSF